MLFEIHRQSDDRRSSAGSGLSPTPGSVFNTEERRWELDVHTLQTLYARVRDEGCPFLLIPCSGEGPDGELPVLVIQDEYDDEEG
jgi:hypothetical protein